MFELFSKQFHVNVTPHLILKAEIKNDDTVGFSEWYPCGVCGYGESQKSFMCANELDEMIKVEKHKTYDKTQRTNKTIKNNFMNFFTFILLYTKIILITGSAVDSHFNSTVRPSLKVLWKNLTFKLRNFLLIIERVKAVEMINPKRKWVYRLFTFETTIFVFFSFFRSS